MSAAERGLAVTLFEQRPELGGQFRLAMAVPGKEDFAETLRYYTRRLEVLEVDVRLSTGRAPSSSRLRPRRRRHRRRAADARDRGDRPPLVRLLRRRARGRVVPGKRVAVIGAGGIGVDVSHFLTHDPAETDEDWMAHWGVGDPSLHRGGLTEKKPRHAVREVTLVQRKETPIGIGLGKTSGWAHRAVLKQSGVTQISGATYDRIDDEGLHLVVDGEKRVLAVDHVVICAGQESVRGLYDSLEEQGRAVAGALHLIGGADVAAELDAKRAIRQGTEVAAAL